MLYSAASRVKRILRRLAIIVCGASVPAACHQWQVRPAPPAATTPVLAITNVTIIDVDARTAADAARPGQTVIIDGDRILETGAADRVHVPRDSQRIDAHGRFLIPGLWDSHTHLSLSGEAGLTAEVTFSP